VPERPGPSPRSHHNAVIKDVRGGVNTPKARTAKARPGESFPAFLPSNRRDACLALSLPRPARPFRNHPPGPRAGPVGARPLARLNDPCRCEPSVTP